MEKLSFNEIFGLILKDIFQLILPTLLVLLVIGIVYTGFQILRDKTEQTDKENKELIIGGISKTILTFIEKLPSILELIAIVTGISLIVNIGASFYKIYDNQKRIKELSVFVKNLSSNDKIAHIIVKEKNFIEKYGIYEVDIYDGITGDIISENEYKVEGWDLRLDALIINFDYSEIGSGAQKNVAFPYRLFSNMISPKNAIILETLFTSENPDELIENDIEGMLGLSRDAFRQRAKEFLQIIKDPLQSQELGIKSSYGNAITIPVNSREGDEFDIFIEGTGGLSFEKTPFENEDEIDF